jgi:hypothetical protein
MSVSAELLNEENRKAMTGFFDEVLGFSEMEEMTIDQKRMIMSCVHWDQFIFLIADDPPMSCPRLDHFGFSVGSKDDLMGVLERAEAYKEKDERVDIIGYKLDDQNTIKIHSVYVKFMTPMMAEIQYWEFVDPNVAEMNRRANAERQS